MRYVLRPHFFIHMYLEIRNCFHIELRVETVLFILSLGLESACPAINLASSQKAFLCFGLDYSFY